MGEGTSGPPADRGVVDVSPLLACSVGAHLRWNSATSCDSPDEYSSVRRHPAPAPPTGMVDGIMAHSSGIGCHTAFVSLSFRCAVLSLSLIYVCVCTCVHMYMCIYMHTHTHIYQYI